MSEPIGARTRLAGTRLEYFSLDRLRAVGIGDPAPLPFTVKILLEGLLRNHEAGGLDRLSLSALAGWPAPPAAGAEVPYIPSRVLLQDFTGVPAVVDLAAMRAAMARAGKDAGRIDPLVPVDLVIDHSVQVDAFGAAGAYNVNLTREYERNHERYALLRWAQQAFNNFTVVPPGMGICHQVNLEYLSRVVQVREVDGRQVAIPDTLVGTDSHTTMVNGLGVLGWGVGGIEAEAAMLGQPMYLPVPFVVGVRFSNRMASGATATDLVLTLTEMLRKHGVVGKFVEFCGDGLSSLSVTDRATLSNMCPEYGATCALFPVDHLTLEYLRTTGRSEEHIALVEAYCRAQGLFRVDGAPVPTFSELLELDLAAVEPSLAGPRRPQDRVPLRGVWSSFTRSFPDLDTASRPEGGGTAVAVKPEVDVDHGSVVIAAITSCTNTSNPSVMVAAGLLARNAVNRGMQVRPYVKTSLAPGSRVVTDYLREAGLLEPLEKLGFYLVGYGCTTCIGNSGPLASPELEQVVEERRLNVSAVLSGNRNFEARIHPLVRSSYLASPPLVVAYALAGTIRKDLTTEPLGQDAEGRDVYLRDIWPSAEEVNQVVAEAVKVDFFKREYSTIFDGDENWRRMDSPTGPAFAWDERSTYVREAPFFQGMQPTPAPLRPVRDARALVVLGDSVTTDHISPAGNISASSPAGRYLQEHGVPPAEFNSYGARRGNHEVMMRGTFANIRLRNALSGGREGNWTVHLPSGEEMTIFDAAMRYQREGTPLVVLAGKEYGSGSSRDWAAKGPALLGVKAVMAESFERIHRSNLVGMGILPLELPPGESAASLGLTGREFFTIEGLNDAITPGQVLDVTVTDDTGVSRAIPMRARVDNPTEIEYLKHGGVLNLVLRHLM